jgi:S-formylglutathione hydrolase FrmB
LFFNNLVVRHIESSVSQLSLFSHFSTISLLWTQFWVSVDTTWTPRWTPKSPLQRQDKVYQMTRDLVSSFPCQRAK